MKEVQYVFLRYSDFKEGLQFKNSSFFEVTHDFTHNEKNGGVFFPYHVFTFKEYGTHTCDGRTNLIKTPANLIFDTGEGFDIELSIKDLITFGFFPIDNKPEKRFIVLDETHRVLGSDKDIIAYKEEVEKFRKHKHMTDYEMQLYLHQKGICLYDPEKNLSVDNEFLVAECYSFREKYSLQRISLFFSKSCF